MPMLKGFCPLASGSKGNCLYLGTAHTKILIDAGLSFSATKERLSQIGVDLKEIDAILISHEHTDHIRGLELLSSKMDIPVLANSETAKVIASTTKKMPRFKIFSTGETFAFGEIEIHPFSVQHDTLDPVGFTFSFDSIKIGVCSDLGFVTTLIKSRLKRCDYLYIEANHEPSMVYASSRPLIYKQRVLGRQGHLSNEMCIDLLKEVYHPALKHVYLAHLSSECNHPELALKKVQSALSKPNLSISIAYQDKISKSIEF
jgi:phosphoribosyl 1,2-cyclic phosphodiesterase